MNHPTTSRPLITQLENGLAAIVLPIDADSPEINFQTLYYYTGVFPNHCVEEIEFPEGKWQIIGCATFESGEVVFDFDCEPLVAYLLKDADERWTKSFPGTMLDDGEVDRIRFRTEEVILSLLQKHKLYWVNKWGNEENYSTIDDQWREEDFNNWQAAEQIKLGADEKILIIKKQ